MKNTLGAPTSPITPTADGSGNFQHFQNGDIYQSNTGCAFEIDGIILDKWNSLGGVKSVLGYPTSDVKTTADNTVTFSNFGNGSIYSHSGGIFAVSGPIYDKGKSLGLETSAVVYPTSDTGPARNGQFNFFQNGGIWWFSDTGAHEVNGNILNKWASMGYEKSYLGEPTSDEQIGAVEKYLSPQSPSKFLTAGKYNDFQNGSIYWQNATGAHDIYKSIVDKYRDLGGESNLGYPIWDSVSTNDKQGLINSFGVGVILWWPTKGAFFMNYPIYKEWNKYKGETGFLGYPMSDSFKVSSKSALLHGFGSLFQNDNSIYYSEIYSEDQGRGSVVNGTILNEWKRNGAEKGCLSLPANEEQKLPIGNGLLQRFIKEPVEDNPATYGDITFNTITHTVSYNCSPAAPPAAPPPPMPVYPPNGPTPCTQSNPCQYYYYKMEYPNSLTSSGIGCYLDASI